MTEEIISKNKNKVSVYIYIFILMFSLFFALWISRMEYRNTAIDLKEGYIKTETLDVVNGIETSIRYGKELTNYYGIEDELGEVAGIYEDTIGLVLLGKDGEIISTSLLSDETQNRKMVIEALDYYDKEDMPSIEQEGYVVSGMSVQVFAIHDRRDITIGYLFVMYERDRLYTESVDKVTELTPLLIVLIVVLLLLLLIFRRASVNKYLPIAIVMSGLFVYMLCMFFNYRQAFGTLVENSVTMTQAYVQDSVDELVSKGLPFSKITEMKDYYIEVAHENEAVGAVEIAESGVVASMDPGYLASKLRLLLLSFGAIFAVSLMISYELTFAIPVVLNKVLKVGAKKTGGTVSKAVSGESMNSSIRMLSFLLYTAIYTSMPYAAVLVRNEGMQAFNMSTEVTAPLPLTQELIAVLVISLIVQRVYAKESVFKLFCFSMAILAVGNLACLRVSTAIFLILLRTFTGVGFALLKYFLNRFVAAASNSDEEIRANFANLNAGLLGGITVGSSLGSILASGFGYYANYLFTAVLIAIVFVLSVIIIPWDELNAVNADAAEDTSSNTSLATIFKNKRLRRAVLLTDIPLNIGLMYVVAFLPTYMGVIGQPAIATSYAYLINGLAGVYVGVWMIKALKKLSLKKSVTFSILLGAAGILVLLFGRNAFIVILSAAIMGLFDGYGTPTLTGYFTGVGKKEKGDSAALLTLYGSIGSGVQIICPMLYGLLASPDGNLVPLGVFGVVFALFGVMFLQLTRREND